MYLHDFKIPIKKKVIYSSMFFIHPSFVAFLSHCCWATPSNEPFIACVSSTLSHPNFRRSLGPVQWDPLFSKLSWTHRLNPQTEPTDPGKTNPCLWKPCSPAPGQRGKTYPGNVEGVANLPEKNHDKQDTSKPSPLKLTKEDRTFFFTKGYFFKFAYQRIHSILTSTLVRTSS